MTKPSSLGIAVGAAADRKIRGKEAGGGKRRANQRVERERSRVAQVRLLRPARAMRAKEAKHKERNYAKGRENFGPLEQVKETESYRRYLRSQPASPI